MKKYLLMLMFVAVFAFGLTSCNSDNDAATDGVIVVTIPHYKTAGNSGALYFLPIVESFNARYEGRFRLNIEPMPQDMYAQQLMLLAGQGMLPVLIEGGLDDEWFRSVIIPQNNFVDLRPHFTNQPVYRYLHPAAYAHNLTADGRMITIPNPIQRPMTMFYNEALFQPSRPISELSWAQVSAELGDNNISFMTSDNAWTTMLAFTSMIAEQPGGAEILVNAVATQQGIMDFEQPPIIAALATLQHVMQTHAQPNAIGANFDEAANAFFNLNSAMIANGPWMVGSLTSDPDGNWGPGFNPETIRSSVLPGNVALFNPIGFNWWIPGTASPQEQELAVAFLQHMFSLQNLEFTMEIAGGLIPGFNYSQQFLSNRAADRLMDDYAGSLNANTIIVPAFADTILSSMADMDFPSLLPLLVSGTHTPQQFAAALSQAARDAS